MSGLNTALTMHVVLGLMWSTQCGGVLTKDNYDPCCSYPCMNFGICTRKAFTAEYDCDCYGTGYYGDNCEILNPMLPKWPEPFNTAAPYTTWDGYNNKSYYALTMPPVPKDCPTPMGVSGPKRLPSPEEIVEKVFTRTKFKPCPRGTSALLPFYGQHLTHQALRSFREYPLLTWGSHTIDASHIYGENLEKQRILRSMKGGKMKMQVINGEEYPPNLADCPGIDMTYPPSTPQKQRFALGHPFFALLPTLLYWSTVWLREHNRVCDLLTKEHPHWDDERLYQTARLIVLGETLAVTGSSYLQQISGINLESRYLPELLHGSSHQWGSDRIPIEFNTLYRWHSAVPDIYAIAGKNYTLKEMQYNSAPLVDNGMAEFTRSLSEQRAGRGTGGRNMAKILHPVAIQSINMNREARLPPFNRYREFFGLSKHKTFEELTGETRLAKVLRELYVDVDAVEFYVGIFVEKRAVGKLFGRTLIEGIGNYAFKILYANPLASPEYWRESTFGGKTGFDIVRNADLPSLICRNIEGCPEASFKVNADTGQDTGPQMEYDDLEEILSDGDVAASEKSEL